MSNYGKTVKPEVTTNTEKQPPAQSGHIFGARFSNLTLLHLLSLNNDNLSTRTTNLGSQGGNVHMFIRLMRQYLLLRVIYSYNEYHDYSNELNYLNYYVANYQFTT
jgi:hypothetical protein